MPRHLAVIGRAVCLGSAALVGLATSLAAQAGAPGLDPRKPISQYAHDAWSIDEGLPQASVFAIAQGRDGYLWLATEAGLVRFDGLRFTLYDKTNTRGLSDSYINALLMDRTDTVWAGTWVGGVMRMGGGVPAAAPGADSTRVNFLYQDRSGTIWAAQESGLSRWANGRFHAVPGFVVKLLTIGEAADGTLLLGTEDGLSAWRDGRITPWQPEGGRLDRPVWTICPDRRGGLWLGTDDALYHAAGGRLRRYGRADGLPGGGIRAMVLTRNGTLWVGTESGGIARLAGERFEPFTTADGMSDDAVTAMLEDREGSLWIGTRIGLNRLREPLLAITGPRQGLSSPVVWSIYGDADGELLVGSRAGIDRLAGGRSVLHTAAGRSVYTTIRTSDGILWMGTGAGVSRQRGGRWQFMPPPFPTSHVSAFMEDRTGALWIAGYFGVLRWKNGALHDVTRDAGLLGVQVTTLVEDQSGTVWIGSHGRGLLRYRDSVFTPVTGLSNEVVEALYPDTIGLWVGTQAGLNLVRSGRVTVMPLAPTVVMADIYAIVEDSAGDLWLTSNEGLARVNKRTLLDAVAIPGATVAMQPMVPRDGRGRIEFNGGSQTAGWRSGDGRLWFASIKGLVMVDPARLTHNPLPPPVHIERLLLDGVEVALGDGSIELPPGGGGLELHYTATSLLIPSRVTFRYMLEAYDADWIDAGNRRVAYYTHVPGGRYRFRVMAANNDGVWNTAGAVLPFRIRLHFYETWWFYALGILAFAAALLGVTRWRVRRVQQEAARLGVLVEERTSALKQEVAERLLAEERLRESQKMEAVGQLAGGIAHDLNNVLTAVMAHVDLAVTTLPAGAPLLGDLTQAQSAAHRGAGMIRKLLGFSRRARLVTRPLRLETLVDDLAATLRRMLPATIDIVATRGAVLDAVSADAGAVQQILFNLANNARDAMPAGGRLTLHVATASADDALMAAQEWSAPGNFVALSVTDTGHGMDPATLARMFEPYFSTKPEGQGTGLGMAMVYGLMKQHMGYVLVASTPGAGTDVRLYFPVTADRVADAAPTAAVPAPREHATILVVEDQESVRNATIRALTRFGYRVLSADDGEAGLQVWRANADAIDLVISDAIMPRMGGLALYDVVTRERPGTRFLLMSGYTGEEVRSNGARAEMPFLPKPWTIVELMAAVKEVLP